MANQSILTVNQVSKVFSLSRKKQLQAVKELSFSIRKGETFGLVGESGCGKSTIGRLILGLYTPTSGTIRYRDQDIHQLKGKKQQHFRQKVQMVFQDPYASLNPRMTVMDIVAEGMEIHQLASGKQKREMVYQRLEQVGLQSDHASRFPHEFSGGQRQRIGIARALAVEPEFIVADEPISALDVSIQAQVVNLLRKLQQEQDLTYLFIAHDLSMVKYISDRVGVMYLGRLVELAASDELYRRPLHPYTQALLSSIPVPDPRQARQPKRVLLSGEVPNPIDPPSGCPFRTRCPHAMKICAEVDPTEIEDTPNHWVACHLYT
ncbi:peptide/nickel transport system ATP-binding protein/oligopeptide transport system ATP-binding protein [Seinonella peptonophila]|uniref:Peptide/nickel transport system ATP-binding protein/oligopeptide transport system ATP-binding protein n=1 Tax=Seinonella peptonophila TaxID=112248 RepID=A0A1M4XHV7_9BACL|nr:ABC transporter ATP-binding protein [Seinonella peptonophila]SHE93089.1 peptide/nickel transport system ATP-binding protein/oligopeptide transport system ATP-binding protein [Seinonella peptonophila]